MYHKDALPTSSIGTTVVTTSAGSYSYHMGSARGQRLTGFATQRQPEMPRESTWYPPVVSHPEQQGGYGGPTPVNRVGTWHDNRYVFPAWSNPSGEPSGLPYPPVATGVRSAPIEASGLPYPSTAMGAKPPGAGIVRDQSAGYHGSGSQSYGGWYEAA